MFVVVVVVYDTGATIAISLEGSNKRETFPIHFHWGQTRFMSVLCAMLILGSRRPYTSSKTQLFLSVGSLGYRRLARSGCTGGASRS
jgi:hypothetical protein